MRAFGRFLAALTLGSLGGFAVGALMIEAVDATGVLEQECREILCTYDLVLLGVAAATGLITAGVLTVMGYRWLGRRAASAV